LLQVRKFRRLLRDLRGNVANELPLPLDAEEWRDLVGAYLDPHKDIVAEMGVTRATVSGLMTPFEREGFAR